MKNLSSLQGLENICLCRVVFVKYNCCHLHVFRLLIHVLFQLVDSS